jgi:hypothetical protein
LLFNQLGAAEMFLARALQVAPGDNFSAGKLADCYLRQDQFARAVPLLRQTGDATEATLYAALAGIPYQVRGAESTRVPIVAIDPLPIVEASLNGGPPQPLILDTGATTPGLTTELADKLGLTAVASRTGVSGNGQSGTVYYGAQEPGIPVDRNHPIEANGQKYPSISPDKISLGNAVGRHVIGVVKPQEPGSGPMGFQFQTIGNFTHEFFKPFAATFDYLRMNLYVTPTVPDGR